MLLSLQILIVVPSMPPRKKTATTTAPVPPTASPDPPAPPSDEVSRDNTPVDGTAGSTPIRVTEDPESVKTVEKLKEELLATSEELPGFDRYFAELSDNVEGVRELWVESAGGARMVWADEDVKTLLSCVLKIENNKNQELLALKGKKVVRTPYKVSEGGMPKPCLNFIAWLLRQVGKPGAKVATADAVKRKWTNVSHMLGTSNGCPLLTLFGLPEWLQTVDKYNAINKFNNFSGGPFPFDAETGFAKLSGGLAAEMDAMIDGTYKGAKARLLSVSTSLLCFRCDLGLTRLSPNQDIKLIKPYRHTGWAFWLHMQAVDEARGGLGKATGNFAQRWVSGNEEFGEEAANDEAAAAGSGAASGGEQVQEESVMVSTAISQPKNQTGAHRFHSVFRMIQRWRRSTTSTKDRPAAMLH
jgi:hypothetical protein